MSKVLLIQPSLTTKELFSRGSETSASIIPPLGIAYIAAYLIKHGHECYIIDGVAQPLSFEDTISIAKNYDIIGITIVSTYALRAVEIVRAFRQAEISQPIIVGGPHVTALPDSMLLRGADVAVIGEGELTMLELIEKFGSGDKDLEQVSGIAFRKDGKLIITLRRPAIDPLDQVPLPARHLLPMPLYKSSIARSFEQPSHSMLTSRGCPGVCTFCSKKTFGSKIRYFSVERIVEEFFLLRDKYGARDVAVWDDNFVGDHDVVIAVCEELQNRGFDLTWSVEARIDTMSRPVLKALKRAGCNYIAYGIESGSQRILDHMHKNIQKNLMREVVKMTKEEGIPIRGYFMLGMPTETVKEMKETIVFAKELDVELASFTLFSPLPATSDYRRALKSGTFPDPEYFYNKIVPEFNFLDEPLYIPEGITAKKLLSIHRKAYNEYYFRPKILMRKLFSIRSFSQLGDTFNGGLTLIKNSLSKS
jgi:anaerobic magnesium-protoporphyrin IX monomethyl ester cyclase